MSLLTMPDEVLVMILSCHSQDKGQLYRTALVSRRLARLTRPILLRSISFVLDYKKKPELDRCLQYYRSCHRRPELAANTRSVKILWYKTPRRLLGYSEEVDVSALVDSLIMVWSNIQHLHIQCVQWKGPESLPSLFQNPFLRLRHLDLRVRVLSIRQALHFLTLPSLREFHVHGITEANNGPFRGTKPQVTTRVEEFHTVGRPLHPTTMKSLLALSQSTLKSLHIRVPGRMAQDQELKLNEMLGAFSPATINDTLHPVRATLARLRLRTDLMTWPSHDGSRLDLADFVSLKYARLSSPLFFEESATSSRSGVWRLLPASIEELTIDFSGWDGLLYPAEDIDETFDRSWYSGASGVTCGWLFEIAACKAWRFPRLRTVTIIEEDIMYTADGECELWERVDWRPNGELLREFERNSILLRGVLRAPMGTTEPLHRD